MSKDTGKPTNKPYVSYKIMGRGNFAQGMAISMERACKSFCDSHGYDSKFSIKERAADHFQIIFQLLDNGKSDFNMRAFQEHLENSGRQPSDVKHRAEITIYPIPLGEEINVIEESADNNAWMQTVQKLNLRIVDLEDSVKDKDSTISGYVGMLGERQKAIDEQARKIEGLEEKVRRGIVRMHDSPVLPILESYLTNHLDELCDASSDFSVLSSQGDIKTFERINNEENLTYLRYVNQKYGFNFSNEDEFEAWKQKTSVSKTWEETNEARKLAEQRQKLTVNRQLLDMAVKSQAEESIRAFLQTKVDEDSKKAEEINSSAEKYKESFVKDRQIYETLGDTSKEYASFKKVFKNTLKRRKEGSRLPVLINMNHSARRLEFYLPSVEPTAELENRIHELVKAGSANAQTEYFGKDSYVQVSVPFDWADNSGEHVQSLIRSITQDKLLNSIGLNPKVITLEETI